MGSTSGVEIVTEEYLCGLSSKPLSLYVSQGSCCIDPETRKPLYSFTIITTDANALLQPIHNRMLADLPNQIGQIPPGICPIGGRLVSLLLSAAALI
jgi:SOS response associated peptidase (SRAP)